MRTDVVPIYTRLRDEVFKHDPSDWQAALGLAQSIDELWFRSQALSHVADICTSPKTRVELIDSAFEAANSIPDINRKVSVSAWPIASALLLGLDEYALQNTVRVIDLLKVEPNPVRRMDACMLLMQKLESNTRCYTLSFDSFIGHARDARSWKVPYNILCIAPVVAELHPERLPELRELLLERRFLDRFDRICNSLNPR